MRIRPWPELSVSGKRLLHEITSGIDRAEIFACDVTYLNSNVAFELGYAVGRFKRIWISLDVSVANAKIDYKHRYTGMLNAGYSPYNNHEELVNAFLQDSPWRTIEHFLLPRSYRDRAPLDEIPGLLYVKPPYDTDSVIAVREGIGTSLFAEGLTVDDPRENAGATLEWYADKISRADVVLVHFLANTHQDAPNHNARASFVAGLAHGMQKNLLMLAHEPFMCPTDYESLIQTHHTAEEAGARFQSWLETITPPRRRARRPAGPASAASGPLQIRDLSLGEPVAENERSKLDAYFVETTAFFEAQEADISVFVGRRGTGKTATFIALEEFWKTDRKKHVCTVKPVGYEVDGLIRLLMEDLHAAERGYLIESLWKFLLYSELSGSVLREIRDRPAHLELNDSEERFVNYVEGNEQVLLAPFSQRVDRAVKELAGLGALGQPEEQRARISEHLHIRHVGPLRRSLGTVLSKKERVAVLIDNLDDQWGAGEGTRALSELLLGLLRVTQDVVADFQGGSQRQGRVNLSLATFIRSDIFAHIEPLASEQDKWPVRRVVWNDRDLLMRVVDERLARAGRLTAEPEQIWAEVFPERVVGLTPKEFVLQNTLNRPRDVIFLTKEAVTAAANRGHTKVTEIDLLDAREKYSRFVFASVLAEDDPRRKKLEAVLFEFAGAPKILPESEIRVRIGRAGVDLSDIEFYLALLCDINFIGIRTSTGYAFAEDENQRRMLLAVAKKLKEEKGWDEVSYEVNAAFYQALQID